METIHKRQKKIIEVLRSAKASLSVTEIDCALYHLGLAQARRTIARDLVRLEELGLVVLSKDKNKMLYRIADHAEVEICLEEAELKILVDLLDQLVEDERAKNLSSKIKKKVQEL